MSVESSEALERSVLEGKDRDALLRIAEVLGVKASSRTKKAEIVDRILEQTGAASGSSSPRRSTGLARQAARRGAARPPRPAATEAEPAVNGERRTKSPRRSGSSRSTATGGDDSTAAASTGTSTEATPATA